MSEEASDGSGSPESNQGKLIGYWVGGVAFLGVVALTLLYAFGDPRPTVVDGRKIGGGAPSIPTVEANNQYYRIRAEYIPLASAKETSDPIGQLWASLFEDAVARAGAAAVQLRLSHPNPLALPRDSDGYLLLDTAIGAPASSAVTPFVLRRPDDKVELRLDVAPAGQTSAGLIPGLLGAMGSSAGRFSGWVSVFSDGPSVGRLTLNDNTALMDVRDFTNRVVGAVRVGIEARNSILFDGFFTQGGFERLSVAGATPEARRDAILSAIDRSVPAAFGDARLKEELLARVQAAFAAPAEANPDAACQEIYRDLNSSLGLSAGDAATIAFLTRFQPGMAVNRSEPICGDGAVTNAVASLGLFESIARVNLALAANEEMNKKAEQSSRMERQEAVRPSGRYVCLGVSGARIAQHCTVLNQIAKEWRGGAKFLQMSASRQYIDPNAGLEEPTDDMQFSAARFGDRRQLLIHIALSRVENFACFRMTRQNPEYFEAMLVVREPGTQTARRVDVFEFAFDGDGRIARIRRRAALPADIDDARSLPETSRCRREFLDSREAFLRTLVRNYWRLPPVSG